MIIHALQRSLENPAVPLSDFDLYDGTSYKADTGERITRAKALEYSPVFKAIDLISGDVAKLGVHIYQRVGDGKDRATAHPSYNMLRWQPNPHTSAFRFYQTIMGHACEGNGYAKIYRDDAGYATEMYVLNPDYVTPVRINGDVFYAYESPSVPLVLEPASEIIHIAGLGFDGLVGYNIWDVGRNSIGMGRASQRYTNKFYANNGRPSMVLETAHKMEAARAKQFLDMWASQYAGLVNAHKTALLTDGMTLKPIASSARDNQLIEAMEFSVRDVANLFRVPPHKLGDTSNASYNSLEQENQSYLDEALDPRLVQFEQELRAKVLTEDEKRTDSHVIEFNRKALLRADMATRGEFYNKATGGLPWLTANEVRAAENLNPLEGFDTIKIPTNNFGGEANGSSDADSDTPPDPTPAADDSDQRAEVIDGIGRIHHAALSRVATRLGNQATRAAKNADDLSAWIDDASVAEYDTVHAIINPTFDVCRAMGITHGMMTARDVIASLAAALQPCLSQSTRDMRASVETAVELWKKDILK